MPAPEATQHFQTAAVLSIAGAHGLHDLFTGFVSPLLPLLIANLSLSKTQAGMLILFLQGPALFQPLIGQLVDRLGLKQMIYLGPAITVVGMSLIGVAPSFSLLAALLLAIGINSAFFHSVGSVMSGTLAGKSTGRGTGLWMFGAEFGRTFSPLLIVAALELGTPDHLPWLMTIGLAGAGLLYVRLRNVPFAPARSASTGEPWWRAIRGMSYVLLPVLGIVTARAFLVTALTTYLPTFLHEEGASLTAGGVALAVFEAAGMLGALFGGSMSDQLGRKTTVLISLLVSSPLMWVFMNSDGVLRLASLVGLGFFMLSNLGVMMALVQESFPQNRALANGLYLASYFTAGSVMSVVVGRLGDVMGLRSAFSIAGLAPLVGAAMVLLLRKSASTAPAPSA
jgi:FSR family fosmidomycin resistance protein-like MFS transporter